MKIEGNKMIHEIKLSKDEKELLAIKAKYNPDALFFYTIDYNEKLYFGVEEFDFKLEGYQIRVIEDFEDCEVIKNFSSEINKKEGLIEKIENFDIDISNFETIFNYFINKDMIISVEHEYFDEDYFFLIGRPLAIENDMLLFKDFDINGNWNEDINYIPLEIITTIRFNSHYTNTWQKYLDK